MTLFLYLCFLYFCLSQPLWPYVGIIAVSIIAVSVCKNMMANIDKLSANMPKVCSGFKLIYWHLETMEAWKITFFNSACIFVYSNVERG